MKVPTRTVNDSRGMGGVSVLLKEQRLCGCFELWIPC